MPVSDELLLKLIYQEENQKALADASAQLENMTQAEKDLIKSNADLASSSDQAAGGFTKLEAGTIALESGMQLARMAVETFKKAWDFAKEGAAIQRINDQWQATAQSFGVNGDQLVTAINKVTGNTLENEAIMQAASRTLTQGLVQNGDQIVQMFQAAQAMSVRFGGSAIDAFQAESMAIETGMTRQLRAQGITVDFTRAYEDYAKAHHKAASEITDEEKVTIRLNEVIDKGALLVKKVGDATGDSLSKIQRFEKSIDELAERGKEAAASWLTPYLNDLNYLEVSLDANASQSDKLNAALLVAIDRYGKNSDEVKALTDEINKLAEQSAGVIPIMLQIAQATDIAGQAMKAVGEAEKEIRQYQGFGEALSLENKTPTGTRISGLSEEDQATAAKEYQSFQVKLSDIESKGYQDRVKIVEDANNQIDQLEANSRDKRISILTSYADDEQKITEEQNKARLDLARTFGLETERMEQDHQRTMQRMSEDHGLKLSKLADSRDALGIEDEIESYNIQRRRAEEDYQVNAERRNQDYAQQLADQSANYEAQRRAREVEKDKQLRELATSEETTRRQIQSAEDRKLQDLGIALANDRNAANAMWTQWREEHGIFLAGEKETYDAFLQYQLDALKAAMGQSGPQTKNDRINGPFAGMASGGYAAPFGTYTVGENGPETLRMGSQGGFVIPNRGGHQFSVSINIGGTNASRSEIEAAVYAGITKVMQAAMQ